MSDYKMRFKTIAILSTISFVTIIFWTLFTIFTMPPATPGLIGEPTINIIKTELLSVIGMLVFAVVNWFIAGAYLYSMKDGAGVKESFKFIWQNIKPYFWVVLISLFIILPGLIAFIIPGLIISIFTMFAPFVFLDERYKGLAAFERSVSYIKGYFWAIVGKVLPFVLIMAGTITVTVFMGSLGHFLPSFSPFSLFFALFNSFIIMPMWFCFLWRLYRDLKNKQPAIPYSSVSIKRDWLKTLVIIGGAFSVIMIIVAVLLPVVLFLILLIVSPEDSQQEIITKLNGENFIPANNNIKN